MKIAKSLIKDFGEQIFKDLDFSELKLESLAQFRTEKFKKYLSKQNKLSSLDFKKEHAILDKEIEVSKPKEKKPKTLIDFLRHGSKEEEKIRHTRPNNIKHNKSTRKIRSKLTFNQY